MTRRPKENAVLSALLCVALVVPFSAGITDEEIFRDVPFNLLNPGARAMSLGGAFTSLADDSSAAQANPAGLVTLRRPELFFEVRATRRDTSITDLSSPVVTEFFDGSVAIGADSDPSSRLSPTFVSYVIPMGRVAFAFSRLESLDVRARTLNSFSLVGRQAILDPDATGDPTPIGFEDVDYSLTAEADINTRVVQYNAAFAAELWEGFSVGMTAVIGTLDMDGRVDNLFVDRTALASEPFSVPTLDYQTRINDSDTATAFNFGLMWRPTGWLSIGGTWRQGLDFRVTERVPASGLRFRTAQDLYGESFDLTLRTPDTAAIGFAVRPRESLTLLVDVARVSYTDLLDGFRGGLNRITFPDTASRFSVADATEIHAGAEYLWLAGRTPVALRVGAWREADHRIHFDDADVGLRLVFPPGEELTHYTAGFGMTLKQSIQIDLAADVSKSSSSVVASTIYRF